jgi:O-antigen biosynthesis protein
LLVRDFAVRDASPGYARPVTFGSAAPSADSGAAARVLADGKHLTADGEPFHARGVTYGGFATRDDGMPYPERAQIKLDLAAMADLGLNTVRTYTPPPPELLELAEEFGLRVLVGLHYRDWRLEPETGRAARRRILDAGLRAVDEAMERCAGDPTVLAIVVGNELPVDLVRLHGAGAVESVLCELVDRVHRSDPETLATYANFPTTEFLDVSNQDVVCFNVFLEQPHTLSRYLAHLQVVAGAKPVLVTELGLAAAVHGEADQAVFLERQFRCVAEHGLAGAMVFSWTDDWVVAEQPVSGWGFGITDSDRVPKPAAVAVANWSRSNAPCDLRDAWPQISVVVCAFNEENTIGECLESLMASDYPKLEIIVCDDGSTDRTVAIARRFPVTVLELPHGGLSRARNAGLAASSGEIVAYLDADAACHPDWPYYLALSFENENVAASGGPNLPFDDIDVVERAVGLCPGGAQEVLVSPERAEHVPGCNMAFRRSDLERVGGFDPVYRTAGDDVDVCWKLLDSGREIAFAAAAQVRHHRRGTVRGFLRQQRGYGRAERLLASPHRDRFNGLGQARWQGFLYGGSRLLPRLLRPVVYTGWMGLAPFQPVIRHRSARLGAWVAATLPLIAVGGALGVALAATSRWWLLLPGLAALVMLGYGIGTALAAPLGHRVERRVATRALVGVLHVAQPFARTWGRLTGRTGPARSRTSASWSGNRAAWLADLERELRRTRLKVDVGGQGRTWDLRVTAAGLVSARVTTAVLWEWEPRCRVSLRPGPALGLVGSASILLAATGSLVGWLAFGGLLLMAAVTSLWVRATVHRAVSATTETRQ